MKIELIRFSQHGDNRGQLVAIESDTDIPFSIKRVYYMYDTKPGVRRGYHAHKNLQQVLICLSGSCKIHLDDGNSTEEVILDTPNIGLYLKNNVWREMYDFTEGSVLMVLASDFYNEDDYIRNYDEFIDFLRFNR